MRGRFVLILAQGRSGSTLIMRLLNSVSGVCISGENGLAFDHLKLFADAYLKTTKVQDGSLQALAWSPPPGLDRMNDLLRDLVLELYNPSGRFLIFGLKEIRYGADYTALESVVGFLKTLFPNMRVVFNTRETEQCVRSSWWAENPTESSRILDTIRANFQRYLEEHHEYCYWMPYEDLKTGSRKLQGMFEFVGIPFTPECERQLGIVIR